MKYRILLKISLEVEMTYFIAWQGHLYQGDDITILGVRV